MVTAFNATELPGIVTNPGKQIPLVLVVGLTIVFIRTDGAEKPTFNFIENGISGACIQENRY